MTCFFGLIGFFGFFGRFGGFFNGRNGISDRYDGRAFGFVGFGIGNFWRFDFCRLGIGNVEFWDIDVGLGRRRRKIEIPAIFVIVDVRRASGEVVAKQFRRQIDEFFIDERRGLGRNARQTGKRIVVVGITRGTELEHRIKDGIGRSRRFGGRTRRESVEFGRATQCITGRHGDRNRRRILAHRHEIGIAHRLNFARWTHRNGFERALGRASRRAIHRIDRKSRYAGHARYRALPRKRPHRVVIRIV